MHTNPILNVMLLIYAEILTVPLIVLVYLGICIVLFAFQRLLIYHSQPSSIDDPATTMRFSVADANLVVSIRPHEGLKALIYFGDNTH